MNINDTKVFFIILFTLISTTAFCQEIAKVRIVYGGEGTLLPVSAKCSPKSFESSFGDSLNFLTTYDKIFLMEFSLLLDRLEAKPDTTQNFDPRIIVIAYKTDNSTNDTIYLGEIRGVYKNGQCIKDNEDFLNLIKAKIGWKNQYRSTLLNDNTEK